jgi:hypothetical protein
MKCLFSRSAVWLVALALAVLACGLPAGLIGNGNLAKTNDLWDDVPRMDGLEASDLDLPLYAKVLVQTVLSKAMTEGKGSGDWIVFTTDKTPADLKAFYTNELMAENGWEASDTSTCVEGSAQGVTEAGIWCVFQKTVDNRYTGLMIIGGEDKDTKKTNIIFIRVEADQTPEPTQS